MKYPRFNTSQVPSLEEAIKITGEKEKFDNKEGLYVDSVGTIFTTLKQKDDLRKQIRFYVNSQGEVTESLEYLQEKTKNDVNNTLRK